MKYQDTRDALNGTQGMRQYKPKTCTVRDAFSDRRGSYEAFYWDGQAHVLDSTAGHYTTCHSLSDGQIRYIKGRANRD